MNPWRLMTWMGHRRRRMDPQFRRTQNWIGTPGCTLANASYVPPPVPDMQDCLGALENFLHERNLPPLVQIALAQ